MKRFTRDNLLFFLKTQDSLSEQDVQRSVRMVTADGIFSSGMGTLQGGVFLSAFAISLGASNYEIGLIATFTFLSQLIQIPGLLIVKALKLRRPIVMVCAAFSRVLWLFIILIPVIFVNAGVSFLLQWLIISMLVGAVAGPAWNSLLRDVLPGDSMGKIMSRRMMMSTGIALVLTLAGGWFVDWWKAVNPSAPLYAFSILFFVGLLFGIAGVLAITRIPEPKMQLPEGESLISLFTGPVKDGNFRNMLVFSGIWTFAINLAVPFFIIYMLKRIGISLFMVTLLTVTSQLTNMMFLKIWGRIADRFSNKSVFAVSGPLFLFVILAWTFTTMPEKYFLTMPLLFVIHIFSGMAMAGFTLASGNMALKMSPKGQAHSYMTVFGIVGALAGSMAPMLGGTIADFFSNRELSFAVNWTDPARELSVYALNFKALDFLFVFAFIVGLFAVNRLSKVKEEGEVNEKVVIDELKLGVTQPLRHMTSVGGLRRMAYMPVSHFLKWKGKADA
ncbi:MFS transporter [Fibrobacterota bacterium]